MVVAAMLIWQSAGCPAFSAAAQAPSLKSPSLTSQPKRPLPVSFHWAPSRGLDTETHILMQSVDDHLAAGEFPAVQRIIDEVDAETADRIRVALLDRQLLSGAVQGARLTATAIRDDSLRSQQLLNAQQRLQHKLMTVKDVALDRQPHLDSGTQSYSEHGIPNRGTHRSGSRGGITEADFTPLINLITDVIASDSWSINDGPGSIRPFPAGVYVDAEGVLQKIADGKLSRSHLLALRQKQSYEVGETNPRGESPQRTISLNRLEKAVQIRASFGLEPTESMKNMAGLTRIDYVFIDSESGEIFVIGPAGPWKSDATGRNVSIKMGRPTMQLDDWIVVLRNVYQLGGKFGCSITPRQENLAKAKQHLANPNLTSRKWNDELREILGKQDVDVFGIDPTSHAARVLVEADYHMKRIGMGLEGRFGNVPSYLDRIESDLIQGVTVPETDLARWWFTLKLGEISACDKRELFEVGGQWVQVLSESELIADDGQRIHTNRSTAAAAGFAKDFTRNFELIADQFPIYYDLQNVFQLALVANLIRQEGLDRRVGWTSTYFASGNDDFASYRLARGRVAEQVESIINEKTIRIRNGKTTLSHRIVGVSGGVEFSGNEIQVVVSAAASESENLSTFIAAAPSFEVPEWWWD